MVIRLLMEEKKKKIFFFFVDEFHQSINVSISISNPSLNVQVYVRQRTIHCQKKVSQK
jgi:hypothetical protein